MDSTFIIINILFYLYPSNSYTLYSIYWLNDPKLKGIKTQLEKVK